MTCTSRSSTTSPSLICVGAGSVTGTEVSGAAIGLPGKKPVKSAAVRPAICCTTVHPWMTRPKTSHCPLAVPELSARLNVNSPSLWPVPVTCIATVWSVLFRTKSVSMAPVSWRTLRPSWLSKRKSPPLSRVPALRWCRNVPERAP
jgi:hypothetical protein